MARLVMQCREPRCLFTARFERLDPTFVLGTPHYCVMCGGHTAYARTEYSPGDPAECVRKATENALERLGATLTPPMDTPQGVELLYNLHEMWLADRVEQPTTTPTNFVDYLQQFQAASAA